MNRVRRFTHVRVTNGRNVWHVSGTWDRRTGRVTVTEIHGHASDHAGIADALAARYGQRAVLA